MPAPASSRGMRKPTPWKTCSRCPVVLGVARTRALPCAERERLDRRRDRDRVGRSAVLLEAVRRTEPARSLRQAKGTTSSVPTQGEWSRVVQATGHDAHACLRDVQRCPALRSRRAQPLVPKPPTGAASAGPRTRRRKKSLPACYPPDRRSLHLTRKNPAICRVFSYSGGGIRTRDLRVMSPTSYQTAPPRGEATR